MPMYKCRFVCYMLLPSGKFRGQSMVMVGVSDVRVRWRAAVARRVEMVDCDGPSGRSTTGRAPRASIAQCFILRSSALICMVCSISCAPHSALGASVSSVRNNDPCALLAQYTPFPLFAFSLLPNISLLPIATVRTTPRAPIPALLSAQET